MGVNLSSTYVPDTADDVIGAGDRFAEMFLAVAWLGTWYIIAMIFCTCVVVDRWRGPNGTRSLNFVSVLAALLLSAAWPIVSIYLLMNPA